MKMSLELTEIEKVQVEIIVKKLNELQAKTVLVQQILSGSIKKIVELRGLDTTRFGVNLAAGRILPVEPQSEGNGAESVD